MSLGPLVALDDGPQSGARWRHLRVKVRLVVIKGSWVGSIYYYSPFLFFMCSCVCICVHVYVHTHMCVWMSMWIQVHIHVCEHVCKNQECYFSGC